MEDISGGFLEGFYILGRCDISRKPVLEVFDGDFEVFDGDFEVFDGDFEVFDGDFEVFDGD
jgi:hypothetical protein